MPRKPKISSNLQPIRNFMLRNYKHFNAYSCVDAAMGWEDLLAQEGKMLVTLAGAMSTAGIGISLAEMIRKNKVHAICCTGANLEEELFRLIAYPDYLQIKNYRTLSAEDEAAIRDAGYSRVTDVGISDEHTVKHIEDRLVSIWKAAEKDNLSKTPYEYICILLDTLSIWDYGYQDELDSWLFAAIEKNIPVWVPGWEDSTLGNLFTSKLISGCIKSSHIVQLGVEQMINIALWYTEQSSQHKIGIFQIGGGIAGDYPICAVPMLNKDLGANVPCWSYFAQISDSTTSYGSYSGACPNEKITWGKLEVNTPSFIIESDATIVAPLIFNFVLGN